VRSGLDPSHLRKAAKLASEQRRADEQRADAGLPPAGSFEAIAREWYEKNASGWADSHAEKIIRRLERDVFPWIGANPIASIRPGDLLALLRRVESLRRDRDDAPGSAELRSGFPLRRRDGACRE
jgi:hypothetical protein